jgi:hypothetical protein
MPRTAEKTAVMQISMWPVDRPVPYARNARVIPQAAIAKVAASIKEFGWQQPIVVDHEDVIIVGHTRQLAARQLGLTEVPVHIADNLTPAQVKAYRLMDNRSNQEAKWDFELAALELVELKDLDFNLEMTGFEGYEIGPMMAADWNAHSGVGDESFESHTRDGGDPEDSTTNHGVTFSPDQQEAIAEAVALARDYHGEPKMTEAEALVYICLDYAEGFEKDAPEEQ